MEKMYILPCIYCRRHCTREGRRAIARSSNFLPKCQAAWHCFCCAYTYSLLIWWEYTHARVYVFTGCARLKKILCSCAYHFGATLIIQLLILGAPTTLPLLPTLLVLLSIIICATALVDPLEKSTVYYRRVWSGIPWPVSWW